MFQTNPAGRAGKLVVANVPLMQAEVAAQVRIVKLLPDAGVNPLCKATLSVPPSVAVAEAPVRFTCVYCVPTVSPPIPSE